MRAVSPFDDLMDVEHMANTQKYINHLLQTAGSATACSEEERAYADELARIFDSHGFTPGIEDFKAAPSKRFGIAVMGIMAFVGSVLMGMGGAAGVIGFLLALAAAVLYVLDRFGCRTLTKLGPSGYSQNVVAYHKATGPLASPRNRPVVVVAHYDTPRIDPLSKEPIAQWRDLIFKLAPVCTVAPGALAVVRLLPLPGALSVLLWVVAIIAALVPLAVAVSFIARRFFMPAASGAICNKSSVAAMLGVMDAVSPYTKGEEFPQDLDFDTYFAEQKRRAEEEALAAASAYGYDDEYADEYAEGSEAEAVDGAQVGVEGLDEGPAADAAADIEADGAADAGEEWPTPAPEGGLVSAGSVLGGAASTVSSLFGSIKNRAEEAGGAASWIRDHIPSRDSASDDGRRAFEPYSYDDAAAEGSAEVASDSVFDDEFVGQQADAAPVASNDPFAGLDIVAPVDDEAAESAAAETSLRNDAGAIRYGLDVVKSLGMLPADCEVEYAADAMPAKVEKPAPTAVRVALVSSAPVISEANADAYVTAAPVAAPANVEPTADDAVVSDPSRSQVFPAQVDVPAVETPVQPQSAFEAVPAAVEQPTLVESFDEYVDEKVSEPEPEYETTFDAAVEETPVVESENSTPRPLEHEGEGTFADPFAPANPLPVDEDLVEGEAQELNDETVEDDASEEAETEDAILDRTSTVMAPLPIDGSLPEYRPQTTYEGEEGLEPVSTSKFDISVVTDALAAFGTKVVDVFNALVERVRELIARIQENRRAREEEMLEEQEAFDEAQAADDADSGLIPIEDTTTFDVPVDESDSTGSVESAAPTATGTFAMPIAADAAEDEVSDLPESSEIEDEGSVDESWSEEAVEPEVSTQPDATAVFVAPDAHETDVVPDEEDVPAFVDEAASDEAPEVETAAVVEPEFETQPFTEDFAAEPLETLSAEDAASYTAQFDSPFISPDFKIPTDMDAPITSSAVEASVPETAPANGASQQMEQSFGLEFEDLFAEPSQLETNPAPMTAEAEVAPEAGFVSAEDERQDFIETFDDPVNETAQDADTPVEDAPVSAEADIAAGAEGAPVSVQPQAVETAQEAAAESAPEPVSKAPEKKFSTQIFTMPTPERETDTVDSLMAEITGSFSVSSTQPQPIIQPPSGNPTAAAKIMPPVPVISSGMKPVLKSVPDPSMPSLRQGSSASRASLFDLPDPAAKLDPFASDSPATERRAGSVQQDSEDYGDFPAPETTAPHKKKKKRGLAGLFGRKKQEETSSMSDWLGVDDDFDAKNSGRGIGSWDNFEDDDWKGGATSSEGATESEMVAAVTSMGDDELLGHDIWFVAAGASDYDGAGTKAFLDMHRDKLRGVFLINLESVGTGQLATVATEGTQRVLKGDRRIAGLVNKVAATFHTKVDTVMLPQVETDAYVALQRSLRALTITGVDGQGGQIAGTDDDLPVNVKPENIDVVSEIVTEVIRRS